MRLIFLLFLVSTALMISSCYYDSEEDLYGTLECNLEDITYATAVLPILQDNCYTCHDQANNFGNITLEGHDKLITYVNNGQLLGAIKRQAGFSPMPQNLAPLLDCEIEKIEAWIDAGALNN